MINCVIFDMDGTIVDSEALYFQLTKEILAEHGHCLSKEVFLKTCGVSRDLGAQVYSSTFSGINGETDVMDVMDFRYAEALKQHRLKIKPGFHSLLSDLKKRGVRIALASSNIESAVCNTLSSVGLTEAFDLVVHAGMVERVKPYPDLFLYTAQQLGVHPSECLVIEDSEPGVVAAAAAGMQISVVPDIYPITHRVQSLKPHFFPSLDQVIQLF